MKNLWLLALLMSFAAQAKNTVEPEELKYKDWGDKKPNVYVVYSGEVKRSYSFGGSGKWAGDWLDASGHSIKAMSDTICAIHPCIANPRFLDFTIREIYLGDASGFKPQSESNENEIGVQSLQGIPPGAKRVLLLNVEKRLIGEHKQVAAIAMDDTSDEDLRRMALEQGVYKVMLWNQ